MPEHKAERKAELKDERKVQWDEDIKDLEKRGDEMDDLLRHNYLLRKYKTIYHKPENILYRLPLTESQRAELHAKVMQEHEAAINCSHTTK